RDPQDRGLGLGKRRLKRRKRNRLPGATRGVGFRIKEQNEIPSFEVFECNAPAVIGRQLESGGLGSLDQLCDHMCLPFVYFPRSVWRRTSASSGQGAEGACFRVVFGPARRITRRPKAVGALA